MTERAIPADVRAGLERPESPDALIWFVTIEHPNLPDAIRVVSDVFDYVLDGAAYTGVLFSARPLKDSDGAPSTELVVPNVDRRIGQAIEDAQERAQVRAEVYSTADFDLSQDPRVPLGTPEKVYGFSQFELSDVQADVAELRGRVRRVDYSQEPWPYIRATADRFPGLYT